jgi:endo-1,3(4)-beta-glucanase
VYTAAVIAHFDPTWAVEYGERVLLMLRDVMNPSDGDAYFPVFRYKDWYSGAWPFCHSLVLLQPC